VDRDLGIDEKPIEAPINLIGITGLPGIDRMPK
jgi:hypothetical protein